jgi:CHAT domain-containing protein/Tfp pilus assembly protein PilF
MGVSRLRNGGALACVLLAVGMVIVGLVRGQPGDEVTALNKQVQQLDQAGKYAEALPIAERYVAAVKARYGEQHTEYATAVTWLFYVLNRRVQELHQAGKDAEALPIAERYVAATKARFSEKHTEYATAVALLAKVHLPQGHYADAEQLWKRALAINEKALGRDHRDVATALNDLGLVLNIQKRYAEALPLYERSLAILEKTLGPNHLDLVTVLDNLGAFYFAQDHYTEAEPFYKRALAIREKALGPDHLDVGKSISRLADFYYLQRRYAEAEPLYKRALAIRQMALGLDHPDVGTALDDLAALYDRQSRYADAEPLYKRALAIREKTLGPSHLDVGTSLDKLAGLYNVQGRYAEAEPLYKRVLAIRQKALGPDHPDVGESLNQLAELYRNQGRYGEAEPLYKRGLAILEMAGKPDDNLVGALLNNLALVYVAQGRYAEAEPLYKRALAIDQKAVDPKHTALGAPLDNLGALYWEQGRYAEAEPLFKQGLALTEKAFGPEHPKVGVALNNIANLYHTQGRYAEAEPLMKRSLAIRQKALGPEHPDVGVSLYNLGVLYFAQRDWDRAETHLGQSADVAIRRWRHGREVVGTAPSGKAKSDTERTSYVFRDLIKVKYRLAEEDGTKTSALARETFKIAQWAQNSEAADAITQLGTRQAKGDTTLAELVRERQDLVGEWQGRDRLLIAIRSAPSDKRNGVAEQALAARLTAIDARIAEIDRTLVRDFPDYATLANPEPLDVSEVQAQLRADEALVLFRVTSELKPATEETFLWVVTKADNRWVRIAPGAEALAVALRCGLDRGWWEGKEKQRCLNLLAIDAEKAPVGNDQLPFNLTRAHQLYQTLFGQVEDLIKDKHLLIVALAQLPFHVLVTKQLDPAATGAEAFRRAAWLAKSNPITVLPSVSSLKALREHAKTSKAEKIYVAFGNPLLEGSSGVRAEMARANQGCPQAPGQRIAGQFAGGMRLLEQRDGLVDVAVVRAQEPLPETADELCSVARDLGVPESDIWLGARATEREVKRLSENGELARYRIVHFATHGALAGELKAGAEPGLILTPPPEATLEDDGYLSASEIAGLKLDADWVILSACNTAAGANEGGEALSGMSRAFFYAGARALLVSHWAVNSDATVKLITKTLSTMAADETVGRSEALRRSMVSLIEQGEPYEAHPAYWAPFVVVGEGAAGVAAPPGSSPVPASAPTAAAKPALAVALKPTQPASVETSNPPATKKKPAGPRAKANAVDWKNSIFNR